MSKILVTGATGIIGTEVVRRLTALGAEFSTLSSKAIDVQGVPARQGNYDDVQSLQAAFSGIDTLFVLLPLVPGKVERARNVAKAAKAAGVKHVVRSGGLVAGADTPYSLPRLQAQIDGIFADTGIPSTFLRNATYMQNYLTFKAPMVRDGTIYAATADAKESLIDARDIAAVAAKILLEPAAHAGKAYTLTGREALTDTERAALLSMALDRPVGFQAVPTEAAVAKMRNEWKMPAELVDWIDSLNKIVSAGLAAGISTDVEQLLGRPPITFAQFAREYASSWK